VTIQERRYLKAAKAIHQAMAVGDDHIPNKWEELSTTDKKTAKQLGRALVDLWDALTMSVGGG